MSVEKYGWAIQRSLFAWTNQESTFSPTHKNSKMFSITSKYFSFFNNTPPACWVAHITRDFLTCYSCSRLKQTMNCGKYMTDWLLNVHRDLINYCGKNVNEKWKSVKSLSLMWGFLITMNFRVQQLAYVAYIHTPNFIGICMILDIHTFRHTLIFSLRFFKVFKIFLALTILYCLKTYCYIFDL